MKKSLWRILTVGFLASLLVLGGCDSFDGEDGDAGSSGTAGAPGATGPIGSAGATGAAGADGTDGADAVVTGTITGTVNNSLSSDLLEGVTVSGLGLTSTATDANGVYALADVAIGPYDLTFSLANYNSASASVNVVAGSNNTRNVSLNPVAAVVASVDNAGVSATYGEAVTLTASVACLDGRSSCGTTYAWTQTFGPTVVPTGSENAATVTYTMPTAQLTKDTVFDEILFDSFLISDGAALTDRVFVHGINPFLVEEEGREVKFEVTATVANGETDTAEVVVTLPELPYDISPGLVNVPTNRVTVVHGPSSFNPAVGGAGYTWTFATTPLDSALTNASLGDAATQHVYFTPDSTGTYTLRVTDGTNLSTVDITAGTWKGGIKFTDDKIADDGKPDSRDCTVCHQTGGLAPDKFTEWRESGHAHILTDNLNTSTHYGTGCFMCHTVGYDPEATNGGIDEAADFDAWLASGMFNVPNADNWANTVSDFTESSKFANVQCENCHGPNDSDGHMTSSENTMTGGTTAKRVSLQSDVCGACHGEPKRHARFQQWQESSHNNNLSLRFGAADISGGFYSGHCGRCHSSQGFRRWIKQDVSGDTINLDDYIIGDAGEMLGDPTYEAALIDLGLNANEITSQTCATCHKVHNPGTSSGEPNDVIMRVTADNRIETPAGYEASGLGLGNLCITCHNGRNGAKNDVVMNPADGTFMDTSTPHHSLQGDVIMGENAFFVNVGQRAAHSYIQDSCAKCHMELTPPPAELSYNLGGTNHTFEASRGICTECHGAFEGGGLEESIQANIDEGLALLDAVFVPTVGAYVDQAVANNGDVDIVDGDCTVLETMVDGALVEDIVLGHSSSITYNGTTYSVGLGGSAACGLVGLVYVDDIQNGILFDMMLNGEYAGQDIVKANWNIHSMQDDGSGGVHNPGWILEVLNESISRLETVQDNL